MHSKQTFALRGAASILALSCGLAAGAAFASGPIAPLPPEIVYTAPAPAFDWTGFYGGLSYSGISGSAEASPIYNFANFVGASDWGAFVGYNRQSGSFVYGAELSYTALNTPLVGYPATFQEDVMELRLRGGYAMDNVLAYGFVGAARSSFVDVGTTFDQNGYSYGIGVQAALRNNITVGVELARREVSGTTGGGTIDSIIDTVSLRVGYQF